MALESKPLFHPEVIRQQVRALGRFQKDDEQFVAVLEGKSARDSLDRPCSVLPTAKWNGR